jgi:deazaflavin-dependent oxidoreductase (nitroreductase family)
MGPMTKVFNPLVRHLAGRRHFHMAAKIHHTGRRSGALYVTPTSARLDKTRIVVPLTFGNRSDWCRNVLAAGGCTVQLGGRSYEAADPTLYWREDLRDQLRGPFNPLERLTFRLLRIRQFLVLETIHEALAVA